MPARATLAEDPRPAADALRAAPDDGERAGQVSPACTVCFGGATVDRLYRAFDPVRPGTSNPVERREDFGGVAHNVALNLARLGMRTRLVSAVGADAGGRALLAHLRAARIDADGVVVVPARSTAEYIAVIGPDRNLAFGVADMAVFDDLTAAHVTSFWPDDTDDAWAFADCNLSPIALEHLIERRRAGRAKLAVDGVSVAKAAKLPADLRGVDLLVLNLDEGAAITGAPPSPPEAIVDRLRARGTAAVVLTRGADGVLVGDHGGTEAIPAARADPVDVTGAGDALIAATLHGLAGGADLRDAVRLGTVAAALTIEHVGSVRPDMSPALIAANRHRLAPPCPDDRLRSRRA